MEGEESKDRLTNVIKWLRKNLRTFLAVTGVASGVAVGFVFRESLPSEDRMQLLLSIPGDLLLRMLRVLTLPMTVSSAITASSELKSLVISKMIGRLIAFHLVSSLVAAMIGVTVAAIVHPGSQGSIESSGYYIHDSTYWLHIFLDYFRNAFPENLVQAGFQHIRTVPYHVTIPVDANITDDPYSGSDQFLEEDYRIVWKTEYRKGMSLLGLVLACTTFGAMCYRRQSSDHPTTPYLIVRLSTALNEITLKMAQLIMWYFPVGVAFLIIADVILSRNSSLAASQVALLVITSCVASAVHCCLLLPLSYWFLTGRNPFVLVRNLFYVLVVSFGCSSSVACLPVTVWCMDEQEGTDPRTNRILLPLGAAICLDGAAIYGAVVGIFLLQMSGVSLSIGYSLYLGLASFVLCFPSPVLPLYGVVYLAQQLTDYVDVNHWVLILSADWIVSRIRALVNVWSSAIGAATIAHYHKSESDWPTKCVQESVPGCSTEV